MSSVCYARQNPKIFPQGLYEESSTKKLPLGTHWDLADGRGYVYVKDAAAGGNTIGRLVQAAAPVSTDQYQAVQATGTVGDNHIHITAGSANLTANQYKDGYINTNDGNIYKINNHAAITLSTAGTINLIDTIRTALTTSSKYSLSYHPCDATIIKPTTVTSKIIGVANITPTAGYYFWAQYKGIASVLVDTGDTLIIGTGVSAGSTTVAGACTVQTENEETELIGVALHVAAADRFALVMLQIQGV